MKKYTHILTLKLKKSANKLIYSGNSFYRKNIIDSICIKENEIILLFERSKRKSYEQVMLDAKSPERYQIFRALSCYYAVTGSIPKLKEVKLDADGQIQLGDVKQLSETWPKERLRITMNERAVSVCMNESGKVYYAALTYFIKSQIDSFPNDCFRAAWSGLNAFYNSLESKGSREADKLNELRKIINDNDMVHSLAYVSDLDEVDFWQKLNWYMMVSDNCRFKKDVTCSERYSDKMLINYLFKYYIGMEKDDETRAKYNNTFTRLKKRETTDNKQRLEFLAIDYCYMLRNRKFHGAVPYPLFTNHLINGGIELKLTDILLLVLKDIIEFVADILLSDK